MSLVEGSLFLNLLVGTAFNLKVGRKSSNAFNLSFSTGELEAVDVLVVNRNALVHRLDNTAFNSNKLLKSVISELATCSVDHVDSFSMYSVNLWSY